MLRKTKVGGLNHPSMYCTCGKYVEAITRSYGGRVVVCGKCGLYSPKDIFGVATGTEVYKRTSLVYNVTEDILVAMETKGVSKKDLASKLGIPKSRLKEYLKCERHIGLNLLSNICHELGLEINIEITGILDK